MTPDIDVIVIGAGVVGLAIARHFALAGQSVLIAEKEAATGAATSSRNSEVIHAGIYYKPGSLKARLCVEGKQLLYVYCEERGIKARRLGKLIVAQTESEIAKLKSLHANAAANGVIDLQWLTQSEVKALEPELRCVAALLSPSTGIVDSQGLILSLLGDAEANGATLSLRTSARGGHVSADGVEVNFADDRGNITSLFTNLLVNCAGHGAHAFASNITGYSTNHLPPRFLAKGSYCGINGKSPFSRLIYPIPVPGALGIHLTLDLQGHTRLGPNIEWVEREDYSVSDAIASNFAKACEGFWPSIHDYQVTAAYCGIRPKIHGPEKSSADFMIQGPNDHGIKGLINLFGIESPGLTSSLAIAEYVWNTNKP